MGGGLVKWNSSTKKRNWVLVRSLAESHSVTEWVLQAEEMTKENLWDAHKKMGIAKRNFAISNGVEVRNP